MAPRNAKDLQKLLDLGVEKFLMFKIDTNGDAVADIAYRVRFSSTANGQSATLRRIEGEQAANTNDSGQIVGFGLFNGAQRAFRLDPIEQLPPAEVQRLQSLVNRK